MGDDDAANASTFLLEMRETAACLRQEVMRPHASKRSRGTAAMAQQSCAYFAQKQAAEASSGSQIPALGGGGGRTGGGGATGQAKSLEENAQM
jgi:uncharacterized membrane protein YgcG